MNKDDLKEATLIQLTAKHDQAKNLAAFLKEGAKLVKQYEPNTKLWFALQENDNTFAIFDVFPDNKAREEHFAGKVANLLKENADKLIEGGWENGVLNNVNNFKVLSTKLPTNLYEATEATFIKINAAPGQSKNLTDFLTAGAEIIRKTEPKTLFWVALQLDDDTYGIFEIFTDESARTEHFSEQVATLFKEQSSTLVQDGWNNGILPNLHNYKILAIR